MYNIYFYVFFRFNVLINISFKNVFYKYMTSTTQALTSIKKIINKPFTTQNINIHEQARKSSP